MCDHVSLSKVQGILSGLRRFNIFVETETINPFRQCERLIDSIHNRQSHADKNHLRIVYAVYSKDKSTRKALYEMISSISLFPVIEIRKKRIAIEQLKRIL